MGKTDLQLHLTDDWRSRRGNGPLPGLVYEGLSGTEYIEGSRPVFVLALSDSPQYVLFEAAKGPGQDIRRAGTGNPRVAAIDREPPRCGEGSATSAGRSARSRRAEGL